MDQEKNARMIKEEGQYEAAKRDDRRCPDCSQVVPYGEDFAPDGLCYRCHNSVDAD